MYNKIEIQKAREVLGVSESSTMKDIKDAFRSLALKTHPDHNKAEDATEKMKTVNSAYEVLNKTQNGENIEIPSQDADFDAKLQQFFAFYAFFFQTKQPGVHDVISEAAFQSILEETASRIIQFSGKIAPPYNSLFGISATQIQRLLEHCAEYDGYSFHFDGHALRPEVLVCLLRYLVDYKPKTQERCVLDLSKNLMHHEEVIDALGYFIEHAQSSWALILDKCELDLTQTLSEQLMVSNKVHSLSIKGNKLSGNNVAYKLAAILENNQVLEVIDFSDNQFASHELIRLALAISKNNGLQKVSLDVTGGWDSESVATSLVVNCLLTNEHALQDISLRQKTWIKHELALELNTVNPRIKNLTFWQASLHPETIQSILTCNTPLLKEIALYECHLTNELLQAIADAIPQALALEELKIDKPCGLHVGQAAIFEAVSSNNTLKKLNFTHYNFGSVEDVQTKLPQKIVADALVKLFRDNKTLTELNIEACNLISDVSAKQLAEVFQANNNTLTKIAMRNVISGESASFIEKQVSINHRSNAPVIVKEKPVEKILVRPFSNEAINTLLTGIKQLITDKADTLKFAKNDENGVGLLTKSRDHYLSQTQLERLMDVVLEGHFVNMHFFDEYHLPPAWNGIILKKINHHYLNSHCPLVSLTFSANDLSGQIDALITLLRISQSLKTLDVANVKMLPRELIVLVDAIANHPTLQHVSLPTCGYESFSFAPGLIPVEGSKSSVAIANLLKNTNTLGSIKLRGEHSTEAELATLWAALEGNKTIESLALIFCEFADGIFAQLLRTNSTIKTLHISNAYSSDATMAAIFNSPWLTELSLENFGFYAKDITVDFGINRQLSLVSMRGCAITNPILGLLKALPLKKLDLSNNRLFADKHGTALLELIQSKSDLLEELKLSNNFLYCNQDRSDGVDSHFLVDLTETFKKCSMLKVVHLDDSRDFSANDTIKCIQQLKAHNPLLQELKFTIPDPFADSYLTKDIWSYIAFHLEEIQLKNQGDWPEWHLLKALTPLPTSLGLSEGSRDPASKLDLWIPWTSHGT